MDLTPTESEALTPVEAVMRSEIAATVIGNVICSICFWLLTLRVVEIWVSGTILQ